jgi:hypothetical protein
LACFVVGNTFTWDVGFLRDCPGSLKHFLRSTC